MPEKEIVFGEKAGNHTNQDMGRMSFFQTKNEVILVQAPTAHTFAWW